MPICICFRYQARMKYAEKLSNGCQMLWSYFGSGHGKGVHDGAGAMLKQSIRTEQMKMESPKLQTAADVVAFCLQKQATETTARNEHRAYKDARRPILRYFHLIKNMDRRKKYDYKYFSGVRSLHSVVSVSHRDVTLLRIRELACFCKECMDDSSDFCINKSHVKEWRLETLEPKNLTEVCVYVYGFPVVLNYNSLPIGFFFSFLFLEFCVI
jgi:hypothetical protein